MATKKPTDNGVNIASLFAQAGADAAKANRENSTDLNNLESGPAKAKIFNIIEYIESPWGLNMTTLYPVQKFIVKLYYHIPLDDVNKTIIITDMFKTKVLYTFTEKEYLKFLYDEGRCNIGEQDHERRELILPCGRRGGKTTLSGIFASYEVYRLLNLHHPQGYYGLPPGNRIQIVSVATDKEQASLLFNEVTGHLARCEYFNPYVVSNTQSDIKFRTPYDIEKFGSPERFQDGKFQSLNGKATLRVTFKSSVAKGLRGAGNIVIILDEMAHFIDQGQSSAEAIYNAVTPSAAAFSPKNPRNLSQPIGPVESRIVAISSPLNKQGMFYDLFQLAMSKGKGSENLLAIQAPTWELNPTIAPSYYQQKYHANPAVFMTEHGAQFSDRVRGWIEREQDLTDCIDLTLRPQLAGEPRMPHQMGIDIGLMNDGTTFVITKAQGDEIIEVYHELWEAGRDWRDSNPHLDTYSCEYARLISSSERLDFDEIANWIHQLTKRFYITDGLFDRWNGIPLQQALEKRGLTQFRSEFFTQDATSKMFQCAKMMIMDRKIRLYDYPIPELISNGKHSPAIAELLALQAEQKSKSIILVEAPSKGHDDFSDALIRAIWLSEKRLTNVKHIVGPGQDRAGATMSRGAVGRFQLQRARAHGGYGTERMNPKGLGLKLRRR